MQNLIHNEVIVKKIQRSLKNVKYKEEKYVSTVKEVENRLNDESCTEKRRKFFKARM